jgi:hypothetical protein
MRIAIATTILACAASAQAAPEVTVSGYAAGLDYAGDPQGRQGIETQARIDVAADAVRVHAADTLDVLGATDPAAAGQIQDVNVGAEVGPKGGRWWAFAEAHSLIVGAGDMQGGGLVGGLGAKLGTAWRAEVGLGELRYQGAIEHQIEARAEYTKGKVRVGFIALGTSDNRAMSPAHRLAVGADLTIGPAAGWRLWANVLGGTRAMDMYMRGQVVEGLVDVQGATGTAILFRDLDKAGRKRLYAGGSLREALTPGGARYLLAIGAAGATVAF